MDIRVLQYFLETAREANMSRAAEKLHISQPTMSKQLKDLEEELGAKLFTRSNYSIKLTEAGMLLRKRAEDIVSLVEMTKAEFQSLDDINSGDVFVGAAESEAFQFFAETASDLQRDYPNIRYNIYSGNMQDVCDRLDKGLLDFAIIARYIDSSKYNFFEIPGNDTWGVIMRKDDPLVLRKTLSIDDLFELPLICSRQWLSLDLTRWFGEQADKLRIVATFNVCFNASIMVRAGMGYAITFEKKMYTRNDNDLIFRPISSVPKSKLNIVWRKHQALTPIAKLLLNELQERCSNLLDDTSTPKTAEYPR